MRSLTRSGGVGLGLLLLFVLTACNSATPPSNMQATHPSTPLNLRVDVDRYEFTTPTSMCSTELTAEVVVGAHGTSHWNTPDGLRPHITEAQTLVEHGYAIYTPVTFSSLHALVDHRSQPTVAYLTMGGQVGQDKFYIEPYPQVADGGHYLIVFSPGSQPGVGKVATWLIIYVAYPIDARGMVTLQQAGSPNEPGPGQPQPEIKLSLTDLRQQLATCQ